MWDPIGIGGPDHGRSADQYSTDEYDAYLLQAAEQLWQCKPIEAVADYLFTIETENMGLTAVPGIRSRALKVAKSICEYVETVRTRTAASGD